MVAKVSKLVTVAAACIEGDTVIQSLSTTLERILIPETAQRILHTVNWRFSEPVCGACSAFPICMLHLASFGHRRVCSMCLLQPETKLVLRTSGQGSATASLIFTYVKVTVK